MDDLIGKTDEIKMDKILYAVRQRYAELFPGWKIVMIPMEKSADRNEQIGRLIELLQNMKT